jgi:hypothetical protein
MVFLTRLCDFSSLWNAVFSLSLEVWLALLREQSRCLMDFVDLDQSARPEVITLPHPMHLPLNFRLISIHSVALFSAINHQILYLSQNVQASFNNLNYS